jgi:hypothetical protein
MGAGAPVAPPPPLYVCRSCKTNADEREVLWTDYKRVRKMHNSNDVMHSWPGNGLMAPPLASREELLAKLFPNGT